MSKQVRVHHDLEVYKKAFDAGRQIFQLTRSFPKEEAFSLTSQIRRSSRSVCANIAEAWRKRRYEKMFINKLSDADSEAAETQVWLEFAIDCEYLRRDEVAVLYRTYNEIMGTLVGMINHSESWVLPGRTKGSDTNEAD